jgi:hypothetical protein
MKKTYSISRIAVVAIVLAVIGVLLVPSDVSLADQAFPTVRAPLYSLNESLYPLNDGFVVVTHMNGPVNFEMKEFQLHGAKPNTQFFIYRVFQEDLRDQGTGRVLVPAGTKLYSGFSFWTDKHGDGHILTPLSPTAPSLEAIKGTVSVHIKNLLYDGPLPNGTLAYEADWYETFFDWEWTP